MSDRDGDGERETQTLRERGAEPMSERRQDKIVALLGLIHSEAKEQTALMREQTRLLRERDEPTKRD